MKKVKIIILLVTLSFCLISCTKNEKNSIVENKVDIINNIEANEQDSMSKEVIPFNSNKSMAKFNYTADFKEVDISEVTEELKESNIKVSLDETKAILKSNQNEIILITELTNEKKATLEQLKEQFNQLANYSELQITIEKNEIVSINNIQVLQTIMNLENIKMQTVTTLSDDKIVTIQYVCKHDKYDAENANIIINSLSI